MIDPNYELASCDGVVIVTGPTHGLLRPEAARSLADMLIRSANAAEMGFSVVMDAKFDPLYPN
jgi:hypothetical protein